MKYEKISIDLESNHALVRCFAKSGLTKTKVTDLGGVLRLFKDQSEMDTGDLPIIGENCIGIRRVYQRGNRGAIFVNGINLKRDIRYGDRTYKKVNLPSLLMVIRYEMKNSKYNVLDTHLFTHENILTSESDQLYITPFGNIYHDSACRICWGSAKVNQLDHLGQSLGMLDLFVSSNFNSDLYYPEFMKGIYLNDGLGNLLGQMERHSQTHDRFPYGEARMRKSRTYGELINFIQNNL